MNELTATSVAAYGGEQITTFASAAAGLIAATVVVGLAIFLVFKAVRWLKGSL